MGINLASLGAQAAAATLYQPFESPRLQGTHVLRPRELLILSMPVPELGELSDDTVIHENGHATTIREVPVLAIPDVPFGHDMVNLSEEHTEYSRQAEILRAKRASGIRLSVQDHIVLEVPTMIREIQCEVVGEDINPIPLLRQRMQARRNEFDRQ